MKIVIIHDSQSCLNPFKYGLNIRQLLNPIFFSRDVKHPDRKRQRCTKLRDRAIQAARELKHMEVPRTLIPPVELYEYSFTDECWIVTDRLRRLRGYRGL